MKILILPFISRSAADTAAAGKHAPGKRENVTGLPVGIKLSMELILRLDTGRADTHGEWSTGGARGWG